eukprot:10532486-Ditylum_brightwellii.AAC.1
MHYSKLEFIVQRRKKKVFTERKHFGIKYNRGTNKDKGESKGKRSKEINNTKKQNSKLKRIIKALKKKVQAFEDESGDESEGNARDQFDEKESKKKNSMK